MLESGADAESREFGGQRGQGPFIGRERATHEGLNALSHSIVEKAERRGVGRVRHNTHGVHQLAERGAVAQEQQGNLRIW